MNYLIGVDVGTSSTKAVLYNDEAKIISQANYGYDLHRNAAGMAEQEPEEVIKAAEQAIHDVAAAADLDHGKLLTVAVSSANQSLLLLDQNKKPLSRLITWADSRAQQAADNLRMMTEGQQLYLKTGTPVHPMSTLTKLLWLKEDEPELFQQTAYFADIKSYLFYRLFNEFKVDLSIASCTGLMNIRTFQWDQQALELAGVNKDQLPEIVSGTTQAVGLTLEAQAKLGIPAETPFVYGAYDGALANIGVGATKQNTVVITIGTSAAVRVVTDHPVIDPERRLFCYALDKQHWVVGGPLNNGGDVYRWAVEHLVDSSAVKNENIDAYTLANHVISGVPAGSHGLLFHPFLGGERAPLWNAKARGSFFGLSQVHTRADMLRSVMEGITMNIATVFQAVQALVGEPASVTANGGFARSMVWRQMLADILNCPVNIPDALEAGCLGAAAMGMQSLGLTDQLKLPVSFPGNFSSYQPAPAAVKVYQRYTPLFQQIEEMLAPAYSEIARLQERQNK